jgi:hypothetical protein
MDSCCAWPLSFERWNNDERRLALHWLSDRILRSANQATRIESIAIETLIRKIDDDEQRPGIIRGVHPLSPFAATSGFTLKIQMS